MIEVLLVAGDSHWVRNTVLAVLDAHLEEERIGLTAEVEEEEHIGSADDIREVENIHSGERDHQVESNKAAVAAGRIVEEEAAAGGSPDLAGIEDIPEDYSHHHTEVRLADTGLLPHWEMLQGSVVD